MGRGHDFEGVARVGTGIGPHAPKRFGEQSKAVRRDSGQQCGLVIEMTVQGRARDTDPATDVPQREPLQAILGDDLQGGR